jgi:kynurenine formamidase
MPLKVIDLTRLCNSGMTVYPGTPCPEFNPVSNIASDGYAEHLISMVSHTGTHIDAPCHVLENAKSLDQFAVDKFTGLAMVIDCRGNEEISREFLLKFEKVISGIDFILFYTGWQFKWETEQYFTDCPTLTAEAAKWLTGFHLKGIGFDSFSVDSVVSTQAVAPETLPNHHILLAREILLIENLTNLDLLPADRFSFHCFPLKIEHADGSPVRAVAIFEEQA